MSEHSSNPATAVLQTELCQMLGCQYPIIQTAMGYVALPELVAATCNAGGFGFLAAVTIPPEEVEAAILKTASLTDKRFGVNFHMFTPGADVIADAVIKHKDKVAAVSYGRGPNPEMIARFKEHGIALIPTVGKTAHAVKAVKLGADAIVVQGGEGGGHPGSAPTSIVVPQTVDAVDVSTAGLARSTVGNRRTESSGPRAAKLRAVRLSTVAWHEAKT